MPFPMLMCHKRGWLLGWGVDAGHMHDPCPYLTAESHQLTRTTPYCPCAVPVPRERGQRAEAGA